MTEAAEAFVGGVSVSRETFAALQAYEAFVRRWNSAINLVSKGSLQDIWARHIADSAQIFALCPPSAKHWADLGSGGGFPGIVVAILAKDSMPGLRVTLVESDLRKATFLRQAIQLLGLSAEVHSQRIESLPPLAADVVSARALAPLSDLLAFADKHLTAQGVAIFPKGARHAEEIRDARHAWSFDLDTLPSLSDSEAAILVIRNIHRAQN
jgi:16S rRNA (guanine527-N7)-methyltransferase